MKDLYELLGITPDATEKEIKAAYKKMAQKTHPDKPGGSQEAFHAVGEAYEILSNPDRRKVYDETGETDERYSDINGSVISCIVQIFSLLIQGDKIQVIDYAKEMIKHFEISIPKVKKEIDKTNNKIISLNNLLEKLTCEDEHNMLADVMNNHITEFNKNLTTLEFQLKIGTLSLERIRKYGFEGIETPTLSFTSGPGTNFFDIGTQA